MEIKRMIDLSEGMWGRLYDKVDSLLVLELIREKVERPVFMTMWQGVELPLWDQLTIDLSTKGDIDESN